MIPQLSVFLLYGLLAAYLIVLSDDFFFTYMLIEMQSFCLYILVAGNKYSNLSVEAALKYFILGSFASAIILFGISLIYYFTGFTVMSDIRELLYFTTNGDDIIGFYVGFFLVIVGFFFKLGIAPFHS